MTVRSILLVCDGTSDLCLQDIAQLLIDEHFAHLSFRIFPAREVIPAHDPLKARLRRAYDLYQPDVILCHRDAEALTLEERSKEIDEAARESEISAVPLIPVRMLESWLLLDEVAIRCAANNRNGKMALDLPAAKTLENLPDPKSRLLETLKHASGLGVNRLRGFNAFQARARITSHIENIDCLRSLHSFCCFERKLVDAINNLN